LLADHFDPATHGTSSFQSVYSTIISRRRENVNRIHGKFRKEIRGTDRIRKREVKGPLFSFLVVFGFIVPDNGAFVGVPVFVPFGGLGGAGAVDGGVVA
jgi:hypothetical protein